MKNNKKIILSEIRRHCQAWLDSGGKSWDENLFSPGSYGKQVLVDRKDAEDILSDQISLRRHKPYHVCRDAYILSHPDWDDDVLVIAQYVPTGNNIGWNIDLHADDGDNWELYIDAAKENARSLRTLLRFSSLCLPTGLSYDL